MQIQTPSRRSAVQALLVSAGWQVEQPSAIASKTFDTAVGPKTAFAYLSESRESTLLTGDYVSEGRNVLAACFALMPPTADDIQVQAHVARFAREAEAAVLDSYAARLLRSA